MKLKTNKAAKNPEVSKKTKSINKKSKGVEVKKDKLKEVVKPSVLKKVGEKLKVEASPFKIQQQDLWFKAIDNVSKKPDLSEQESIIVKLLSEYKNKSSIPHKKIKLQNFIVKGFSKFKDTSDETFNGLYDKLFEEFKSIGGSTETKIEKSEKKTVKTKLIKDTSDDEEIDIGDEEEEEEEDEDEGEGDDDDESIELGDSDEDVENESEEEKPKPKAKGNKNGKTRPSKAKNGSKFQSGKVQKNKKFGKKK